MAAALRMISTLAARRGAAVATAAAAAMALAGAATAQALAPASGAGGSATTLPPLLPDQLVEAKTSPSKDWKAVVEISGFEMAHRYPMPEARQGLRLAIDASWDTALSAQWRLVAANRWVGLRQANTQDPGQVNTLKELYLSWQGPQSWIWDGGRINVRNGVASGYNPVDLFKADAVRDTSSVSPANLRENRQGSVMLRAQKLWAGGSLTLIASPRLATRRDESPWGLNVGATNGESRWQLAWSPSVNERLSPQFALSRGQDGAVQGAASVSALLTDSLIAFGEISHGRQRSQLDLALGGSATRQAATKGALGLTWTLPLKLAVTLEYDRNAAAPGREQWAAMAAPQRAAYGSWVQAKQELAVAQMWWLYVNWQDAMARQLDLNAFVRFNPYDSSAMRWLELRYHLPQVDLGMSLQQNSGSLSSLFGGLPRQRVVMLSLTWFN